MPNYSPIGRILVVDDEPHVRELLVDALSAPEMEVCAVASGAEAVELAKTMHPDILVTDLRLGDGNGLEVIDHLRTVVRDIPAVVITGHGDAATLTEASRHRPLELMTKPLDVEHLRQTVREELSRQWEIQRDQRRTKRLRKLAKLSSQKRRQIHREFRDTNTDLTEAYRALSGQLAFQQVSLDYQHHLLSARTDDDVFGVLFRYMVQRSGPLFGVAMVCDGNAELQIIGRFGVPVPDGLSFCEAVARPMIDVVLTDPRCQLIDAQEHIEMFDEAIHKYLVGVSVLAVPLIPAPGEMIGLVVLYRKGEQPFTDGDLSLVKLIGPSTAAAIRRND